MKEGSRCRGITPAGWLARTYLRRAWESCQHDDVRFYDPDIGRLINPDPIGLLGRTNLYRYAANSLMWIDPLDWACGEFSGNAQEVHNLSGGGDARSIRNSMVSIVEAKVNGKPQLFAAGSGGRLSPTQRQALMKMGVPEENIFYGKNSIYGFDKLENHAERIILRNLTEGTEVSRWGISWGELQRNASCPSCQPHVEQAGGIFDWKISMFDIEMHKKYIESILAAGKRENLARFGVWCCIGLAHDDSIFEFLAMHMGSASTQIKQRVRDYLDQVWNGNENANPLNDLEQVDWDPDAVEMNDDAAVQGATDLLAGLSLLIKWCAEHNVARLVECAEVLINRIDYLESFELIGGCVANPVDGEMNSQKIFARDLVVGGVSDQDKMKYHEWLFSL